MLKIATIVGTRPNFIKSAPVSKALKGTFEEVIINTGQHYDDNMAGNLIEELEIEVRYDCGTPDFGYMESHIEEVLEQEKPAAIIVYGDTNSSLAGALAASRLRIPVAHIEAGVRSFNRGMMEESNRIIIDLLSEFKFAPTIMAYEQLIMGGHSSNIYNVGDVMYDAILGMKPSHILDGFPEKYFLCTMHRAENVDDKEVLSRIFDELYKIKTPIIWPIHPRTYKRAADFGLTFKNIIRIDPVGYYDMLALESNATAIITDSGGVQKEAYYFRVPCITLRKETEWPETVDSGWSILCDPMEDNLLDKVEYQLTRKDRYHIPEYERSGASERIVEFLKTNLL